MKLFLDSAHIDQIREVKRWGILDGVTTNPTHVAATGRKWKDLYKEICDVVDGPVSLETVGLEAAQIIDEAHELVTFGDNVVVKVPVMKEGLIAVKKLKEEGIDTNVTVTFSPTQALLAAKCGARFISPFVGRLDAVGQDGCELVRQIRAIYDNYSYQTEVLFAAVRHPMHVVEAALAGADICTLNFEVMDKLYDHPLTDIGIDLFLKDWATVPK